MGRKHVIIAFVLLGMSCGATAQSYFSRGMHKTKAYYVEAGGNSILATANFDKIFYEAELIKISWRVGAGYAPLQFFDQDFENYYTFLFGFNEMFGMRNKYFEIGFNGSYTHGLPNLFDYLEGDLFLISGNIGFRRQSHDAGLMFRINFTPYLYPKLLPMVGLSIGQSF